MKGRAALLAAGLGAVTVLAGPAQPERAARTSPMLKGAAAWLESLSPELRSKAILPLEDPRRLDWHFVPRQRPGVLMSEMNDRQRMAARELLRNALSARGCLKVDGIMQLDAVLRDVERGAGGDGSSRDPGRYALVIFGEPSREKAWGWRLEGHHISLNFVTGASEQGLSVTPLFLGANPAEIRQGRLAGSRVLATEQDLGLELLTMLDEDQRFKAVVSATAPPDILMGPGKDAPPRTDEGLSWRDMREAQRALLMELIGEYAHNLRLAYAAAELDRIREAGLEQLRFVWAGGQGPGQGHYYRIQGPTFVIEYDNTQNGANHIHTVWRDPARDLGRDLLREHLQSDHGVR
jgi:hypothetical protein